jgi:hypothetical protein
MRKNLLLLPVLFSLVLTSCNLFNNYGKKVKINDKLNVYYKGEGVTEDQAKKLGAFLENNRGENKGDLAAQIMKEGESYLVKIPLNEEAFNKDKEKFKTLFWYMQDMISELVFEGKKTRIVLTDDKLKDKETIDEITKITVGKEHYVYLKGNGVEEKEGKRIADSLELMKFFDYTAGAVLVTKEKGQYSFRFMANDVRKNDQSLNYDIVLENLRYIISKYVMNGSDINLVMIDTDFHDIKKINEPPADRKLIIDNAIAGQPSEPTESTQYTNNTETSDDDGLIEN